MAPVGVTAGAVLLGMAAAVLACIGRNNDTWQRIDQREHPPGNLPGDRVRRRTDAVNPDPYCECDQKQLGKD